jgi:hypothetical protein
VIGLFRIVLAVAAALTLVAVGCGQDERKANTAAPAGVAVADTGAGEQLPLGRRAVSPFVDYGTSNQSKPTKVGVSVLAVRKGRIADFEDFKLNQAQRRSIPYYVDAKFENLGDFALSRSLLRASAEDTTGREYRPTNVIVLSGSFRPCPEYSSAKLRAGQSFIGCSAILLPKRAELGRVRFQGDVTRDPLFWEARS